jgi:hypothetical protein
VESQPLVVTVELAAGRGGEQIAGRVRTGDDPGRQFTGWLQLMSALQDGAAVLTEPPGESA